MARVPTDVKRLFVRVLTKSVEDGDAPSLRDALFSLAQKQFKLIHTGELIVSTSADGFAATYSLINPAMSAGVSPVEIAALGSELLDLYDSCAARLTKLAVYGLDSDTVAENGWPVPLPAIVNAAPVLADADIAAAMLARLVARTSSRGDYSLMDVAATV